MSLQSSPKPSLADEALRIISTAQEREIILRLMGALVVRMHCRKYLHLHDAMKRELTDLDFMTYRSCAGRLTPFFVSLGYAPDEHVLAYFGDRRHKYYGQDMRIMVDVFIDNLEMCHKILFDRRLELDFPTITLADFILEKMQIVQINEKDIKDTVVIMREHDVGDLDNETVNARYIARTLSDDWGFYYTVTTNLGKVKNSLSSVQVLSDQDRADVSSKIDKLVSCIEEQPKSMRWKMRAKIGTKKKWYNDVEEVVR
jgi:hypothetical protein